MNEFERRWLAVMQNHKNLMKAARDTNALAIVEYFGYSGRIGTPVDPLAPGVARQLIIPIQADSYFALSYISCAVVRADSPAEVTQCDDIVLQLTDTGAGATLYSAPTIGTLISGSVTSLTIGIPLLLTVPRIIPPNTNVKIDVTNFLPATNINGVFVSLNGARVSLF